MKVISIKEANDIIRDFCQYDGINVREPYKDNQFVRGAEDSVDVATFMIKEKFNMELSEERNCDVVSINFIGWVRSMPSDMSSEDLRRFANKCISVANTMDRLNNSFADIYVEKK